MRTLKREWHAELRTGELKEPGNRDNHHTRTACCEGLVNLMKVADSSAILASFGLLERILCRWQRRLNKIPPNAQCVLLGLLLAPEGAHEVRLLRCCTDTGRPFDGEEFVAGLEERFQRRWRRRSVEGGNGLAEGSGAGCCVGIVAGQRQREEGERVVANTKLANTSDPSATFAGFANLSQQAVPVAYRRLRKPLHTGQRALPDARE